MFYIQYFLAVVQFKWRIKNINGIINMRLNLFFSGRVNDYNYVENSVIKCEPMFEPEIECCTRFEDLWRTGGANHPHNNKNARNLPSK